MPIFFQEDIDETTRLGIWKIEEAEDFFLKSVVPQRNVSHPHKKLQHLAGRYLLKYLFPHFPLSLILIADTRKPYLENEAYHFSISHCGEYAAAIVSKTKRVGVDIEMTTEKVERIKHKFLSEEERKNINNLPPMVNGQKFGGGEGMFTGIKQLTLLWSCKEAVFKWYGLGEVDFKEHIVVQRISQIDKWHQTIISFEKGAPRLLLLKSFFFTKLFTANKILTQVENQGPSLVLSYVIT